MHATIQGSAPPFPATPDHRGRPFMVRAAALGSACVLVLVLAAAASRPESAPALARVGLAAVLAAGAAVSLPAGAALALFTHPSDRVTAAVMAFGSGALIQALAVELAFGGAERLVREAGLDGTSGWLVVAGGFALGGLVYTLANRAIEQRGGALRKPATAKHYLLERKREESAALLERLAGVELLRSLPPEDMQEVLPYVRPVAVEAGTVIFHQGDQGDALYLIDRGQVAVHIHPGRQLLATLGAGQSFGEMALLSGEPRSATVTALSPVTLLRIGKTDFDHLLVRSPQLRRAVEELNAQRLLQNVRGAAAPAEAERWQRAAVQAIQRLSRSERLEGLVELREHAGGAPLAIFLGALLDGIPESVVIGASFTGLAAFNPTFLMAVFLSNLPEAMSSAAGMRSAGFSTGRVFVLWGGLVAGGAVAAALGNAFLVGAPAMILTFVEAVAGGGILAMLAATMMPEAFEQGGPPVGLATIAGFLSAFFFTALELR